MDLVTETKDDKDGNGIGKPNVKGDRSSAFTETSKSLVEPGLTLYTV